MRGKRACTLIHNIHLENCSDLRGKFNMINEELSKSFFDFDKPSEFMKMISSNHITDSKFYRIVMPTGGEFLNYVERMGEYLDNIPNNEKELEGIKRALMSLLTSSSIQLITDSFPLDLGKLSQIIPKEISYSFAAIALLIFERKNPSRTVMWLGENLIPINWHERNSGKSGILKLSGLFMKKKSLFKDKKLYWGIVTQDNKFLLYKHDNLKKPEINCSFDHADGNGKSLKIWKDSKQMVVKLKPISDETYHAWANPSYLINSFFTYESLTFPDQLIDAFESALISSDEYVLRAMLDFDVIQMGEAPSLMFDLFKVFSSNGLVHRFISTVATTEFSSENITEGTVLRRNSHLTFLFKVYYNLFSSDFYNNVLTPIIHKVAETGDLGIKEKDSSKKNIIGDLIDWVLDVYLNSYGQISPQFHHFAAVLQNAVFLVLQSKHSVFNVLSSFMCLRYSNAILADPSHYKGLNIPEDQLRNISIQFAQLLQSIFNLQLISERYEYLTDINEKIITRYEDIYNFVISIANFNKEVVYPKFSDSEKRESLINLMICVSKNHKAFNQRYKNLYDNGTTKSASVLAMSNLFIKMFQ